MKSIMRKLINKKLATTICLAIAMGWTASASAAEDTFKNFANKDALESQAQTYITQEFINSTGLGAINADKAYALGYSGNGVTVGVLEAEPPTYNHREFNGKNITYANYTSELLEQWLRNDNNLTTHGTHVAGIIAASKDNASIDKNMHGVAYDSNLELGTLYSEFNVNFFDNTTKVINCSFGYTDDEESKIFVDSVKQAILDNDRIYVKSAGNNNGLNTSKTTAEYLLHDKTITQNMINVVNVTLDNAVEYGSNAVFSNNANTVSAPGANINSINSETNNGYTKKSGTSMAAPHVSGTIALVQEAMPYLNGKQLVDTILSTANKNVDIPEYSVIVEGTDVSTAKFTIVSTNDDFKCDNARAKKIFRQLFWDVHSNENLNWFDKFYFNVLDTTERDNFVEQAMRDYEVKNLTFEELYGQGFLDAGRAVQGPGSFDSERLSQADKTTKYVSDYTKSPSADNTYLYKVNTGNKEDNYKQRSYSIWSNDITQDAGKNQVGLLKTGQVNLLLIGNNTYKGPSVVEEGGLVITNHVSGNVYAGGTDKSAFAALTGYIPSAVYALENGSVSLSDHLTLNSKVDTRENAEFLTAAVNLNKPVIAGYEHGGYFAIGNNASVNISLNNTNSIAIGELGAYNGGQINVDLANGAEFLYMPSNAGYYNGTYYAGNRNINNLTLNNGGFFDIGDSVNTKFYVQNLKGNQGKFGITTDILQNTASYVKAYNAEGTQQHSVNIWDVNGYVRDDGERSVLFATMPSNITLIPLSTDADSGIYRYTYTPNISSIFTGSVNDWYFTGYGSPLTIDAINSFYSTDSVFNNGFHKNNAIIQVNRGKKAAMEINLTGSSSVMNGVAGSVEFTGTGAINVNVENENTEKYHYGGYWDHGYWIDDDRNGFETVTSGLGNIDAGYEQVSAYNFKASQNVSLNVNSKAGAYGIYTSSTNINTDKPVTSSLQFAKDLNINAFAGHDNNVVGIKNTADVFTVGGNTNITLGYNSAEASSNTRAATNLMSTANNGISLAASNIPQVSETAIAIDNTNNLSIGGNLQLNYGLHTNEYATREYANYMGIWNHIDDATNNNTPSITINGNFTADVSDVRGKEMFNSNTQEDEYFNTIIHNDAGKIQILGDTIIRGKGYIFNNSVLEAKNITTEGGIINRGSLQANNIIINGDNLVNGGTLTANKISMKSSDSDSRNDLYSSGSLDVKYLDVKNTINISGNATLKNLTAKRLTNKGYITGERLLFDVEEFENDHNGQLQAQALLTNAKISNTSGSIDVDSLYGDAYVLVGDSFVTNKNYEGTPSASLNIKGNSLFNKLDVYLDGKVNLGETSYVDEISSFGELTANELHAQKVSILNGQAKINTLYTGQFNKSTAGETHISSLYADSVSSNGGLLVNETEQGTVQIENGISIALSATEGSSPNIIKLTNSDSYIKGHLGCDIDSVFLSNGAQWIPNTSTMASALNLNNQGTVNIKAGDNVAIYNLRGTGGIFNIGLMQNPDNRNEITSGKLTIYNNLTEGAEHTVRFKAETEDFLVTNNNSVNPFTVVEDKSLGRYYDGLRTSFKFEDFDAGIYTYTPIAVEEIDRNDDNSILWKIVDIKRKGMNEKLNQTIVGEAKYCTGSQLNDTINVINSSSCVNGYDGNDTLTVYNSSNCTLIGGKGSDYYKILGPSSVTIDQSGYTPGDKDVLFIAQPIKDYHTIRKNGDDLYIDNIRIKNWKNNPLSKIIFNDCVLKPENIVFADGSDIATIDMEATLNSKAVDFAKLTKESEAESEALQNNTNPAVESASSSTTQVSNKPLLSNLAMNSKTFNTATYAAMKSEYNNLSKRLGDLRLATEKDGVWVRTFKGKEESSDYGFKKSYNAYQVGYDKKFTNIKNSSSWFVGLAGSYYKGSTTTDHHGKAEDRNREAALYASYLGNKGHYLDIVARHGRLASDITSYATGSGKKITGDMRTWGSSLGVEYGRKLDFGKGFYLQPEAELIYGRTNSSSYDFSDGSHVKNKAFDSCVGRAGLRFGVKAKDYNVYGSLSYNKDFGGKKSFSIKDKYGYEYSDSINVRDSSWEFAIGGSTKVGKDIILYADTEKSFGGKVTTKWRYNIGLRCGF